MAEPAIITLDYGPTQESTAVHGNVHDFAFFAGYMWLVNESELPGHRHFNRSGTLISGLRDFNLGGVVGMNNIIPHLETLGGELTQIGELANA